MCLIIIILTIICFIIFAFIIIIIIIIIKECKIHRKIINTASFNRFFFSSPSYLDTG